MTESLIPDGYEIGRHEDSDGRTFTEVVADNRRRYWWPLRRMMLELGVDGETYVQERAKFRRLMAAYMLRWMPSRLILKRVGQ